MLHGRDFCSFKVKVATSFLLGTAAALCSVVSAQAADLPVKARPVEYVKVCNVYGAGFFYVPGTDTCLKIGAYLRSDHLYGAGNASSYYFANANARFTRADTNFYAFRARINLTTDWRTQTDYGVLRAYAAIIAQQQTGDGSTTGTAGILRAFIQFAGFTVGHAVSYFDFFNTGDYTYLATTPYSGTTANNGIDLIAYTWQIGNGWSATLSAEDGIGRGKVIVNASSPAQLGTPAAANTITTDRLGAWSPDITGSIRLDQAWGSFQVMAAAHEASGAYYAGVGAPSAAALTSNGHPDQAWGWAVGGGVKLTNFLAPKDTFEVQGTYAKGATGYVTTIGSYGGNAVFGSGNSLGVGYATDGVFVTGSSVELTEAWGVAAAYQHNWNSQWRTSVAGGYIQVNYKDAATAMLCGTAVNSAGAGAGLSTVFGTFVPAAGFGCDPNYSVSTVGTRTAWKPHPTLEIGLDLVWNHIDTAFTGLGTIGAANGARPPGVYQFEDQDNFLAIMRVQKSVLP